MRLGFGASARSSVEREGAASSPCQARGSNCLHHRWDLSSASLFLVLLSSTALVTPGSRLQSDISFLEEVSKVCSALCEKEGGLMHKAGGRSNSWRPRGLPWDSLGLSVGITSPSHRQEVLFGDSR